MHRIFNPGELSYDVCVPFAIVAHFARRSNRLKFLIGSVLGLVATGSLQAVPVTFSDSISASYLRPEASSRDGARFFQDLPVGADPAELESHGVRVEADLQLTQTADVTSIRLNGDVTFPDADGEYGFAHGALGFFVSEPVTIQFDGTASGSSWFGSGQLKAALIGSFGSVVESESLSEPETVFRIDGSTPGGLNRVLDPGHYVVFLDLFFRSDTYGIENADFSGAGSVGFSLTSAPTVATPDLPSPDRSFYLQPGRSRSPGNIGGQLRRATSWGDCDRQSNSAASAVHSRNNRPILPQS